MRVAAVLASLALQCSQTDAVGGRIFGVQVSDPEAPEGHILPSVIEVVDHSGGRPDEHYARQETLDAAVRYVPEEFLPLVERGGDSSLLKGAPSVAGDLTMVCPDGSVLEGDKCIIRVVREPMISCPIGALMSESGACEQADYVPPDLICPALFDVFLRGCIKRVRVPPSASCPPGTAQHGSVCLRETEYPAEAKCRPGFILTNDPSFESENDRFAHLGCVRYVSIPASVMCPKNAVPVPRSLLARVLRDDGENVTAAVREVLETVVSNANSGSSDDEAWLHEDGNAELLPHCMYVDNAAASFSCQPSPPSDLPVSNATATKNEPPPIIPSKAKGPPAKKAPSRPAPKNSTNAAMKKPVETTGQAEKTTASSSAVFAVPPADAPTPPTPSGGLSEPVAKDAQLPRDGEERAKSDGRKKPLTTEAHRQKGQNLPETAATAATTPVGESKSQSSQQRALPDKSLKPTSTEGVLAEGATPGPLQPAEESDPLPVTTTPPNTRVPLIKKLRADDPTTTAAPPAPRPSPTAPVSATAVARPAVVPIATAASVSALSANGLASPSISSPPDESSTTLEPGSPLTVLPAAVPSSPPAAPLSAPHVQPAPSLVARRRRLAAIMTAFLLEDQQPAKPAQRRLQDSCGQNETAVPACPHESELVCGNTVWPPANMTSAVPKELLSLTKEGVWTPAAVAAVGQHIHAFLVASEETDATGRPGSSTSLRTMEDCKKKSICSQLRITSGLWTCPAHLVLRSSDELGQPMCEGQEREAPTIYCPLQEEEDGSTAPAVENGKDECKAVAVAALETKCPTGFHVGIQEDPYLRPGQKAKWRYPGEPSVKPEGDPRALRTTRRRGGSAAKPRELYARQEVDWGADHIIMLDGLCERIEYAEYEAVCPLGYIKNAATRHGRGTRKICAARKVVPGAYVCEPGFLAEEDEEGNQICVKTLAATPTLLSAAFAFDLPSAGAVLGDLTTCVSEDGGLVCGGNARFYGDATERGAKMGERFNARRMEKAGTRVTPISANDPAAVNPIAPRRTRSVSIWRRGAATIF